MKLLKVILCAVLVIALALCVSLMGFAVQSVSETKEQPQIYESETYAEIAAKNEATVNPTTVITKNASSVHPFEDVAVDSWYNDAVVYVYENGLMSGTSTTTFDPEQNMTRAMLVTVLYRLAGSPEFNGANVFADVVTSDWYYNPVVWAYTNGIVAGTSMTTFSPDNNITREQMVTIFSKYAAYKNLDTTADVDLASYADRTDISAYAVNAFKWAVDAGIVSGTSATSLSPQGTATRAQCAVIMRQFERWVGEQNVDVTPVPTVEPTPTVTPVPTVEPTPTVTPVPSVKPTPNFSDNRLPDDEL